MKYIRVVERGAAGEIGACLQYYLAMVNYVDSLYVVVGNLTQHLARIRSHAIDLVRDHALAQLDEASALAADGQEDLANRRRKKAFGFFTASLQALVQK